MRSIRNRAAALTATALLSTLALTACGNGHGVQDAGGVGAAKISTTDTPATTTADTKKTDTAPDAADAQAPRKNGSGTSGVRQAGSTGGRTGKTGAAGGGSKGSGSDGGTSATPSSCTAGSVKLAVVKVERPLNHMLLTATNTGSRTCDAYNAPFLRFDQDQSATQVMRDSVPQAVVSLSPGQTAYASILMSSGDGSGAHGRTAEQLGVFFSARSGEGSVGDGATLSLPAGSYIDDSAAVSYWQSTMDLALAW